MLKIAAVALVSAMLGGVFGVALWRALDGTSKRVDALEGQNVALFSEAQRVSNNDKAIIKTMTDMLADIGGELYKAGLIDEKQQFIAGWWCLGGTGACYRSKASCELFLEKYGERGTAASKFRACVARRVAWCERPTDVVCVGARENCTVKITPGIEVLPSYRAPCLGIE